MMAKFTSKIAAFVVALMMNAIIFSGVDHVFNIQWNNKQAGSPNLASSGSGLAPPWMIDRTLNPQD
jgi:uncharacterized membrane protein